MDDRALAAALLTSAVSELLLLLFVVPPPVIDSFPPPYNSLSPSVIQFLSISQAAALSRLSGKRKRPRSPEPDDPTTETETILSKLRRRVGEPDFAIPTNPDSFNLYFNMTSSTFEWLSSLLEPLLECRDPVDSPLNLPVETRLGVGLFRLATGSDYVEIARRFEVSEHVARFCVNQLCRVLCTDFRFWVRFPTQQELEPISQSFETLTGLLNCCGVIHCTRFKISKHKSIAAQIVVDSSSKILSIVAGFNAEKGNQIVLKSSSLYKDIESKSLLNSQPIDIDGVSTPQYLIGDRGYPCLPWLMVPFDHPVANSNEENFNSAHSLMLVSGFRTVDSLKKWGALSKQIDEEIKTMVAYIGACSILHNALLMREDYSCLSEKSDEYFRCNDSQERLVDASFDDDFVEQKGFEIRSALARRAGRCL